MFIPCLKINIGNYFYYFTMFCIGRAFDELYVPEVMNQCEAHDSSNPTVLSWKYNDANPLKTCIRKFSIGK